MNPILAEDLARLMENSKDLFRSFDQQKIFITGGTGLFGKWLLHTFQAAQEEFDLDLELHVLSRNPKHFLEQNPHFRDQKGLHWIQGDVRDFEFPNIKVDSVIHAATEASVKLNEEDPGTMLDTIIAGTQRTLDFAIHAKAKRFLITSSGGVYARPPTSLTHIPEDYLLAPDPLNSRSAYAEGKRVSELLGAIYQKKYGLQVLVARCFGFVGPYFPLNTSYAVGNFILNVLKKEEIQIGGDGTPLRSFMYMADLTEWLLTILQKGEPLKPYHVGSEECVSVAELAQVIVDVASQMNLETKGIRIAKTPEPGRLPECYTPKTDLASKLGLHCRHNLQEGVRRTILWNLEKSHHQISV